MDRDDRQHDRRHKQRRKKHDHRPGRQRGAAKGKRRGRRQETEEEGSTPGGSPPGVGDYRHPNNEARTELVKPLLEGLDAFKELGLTLEDMMDLTRAKLRSVFTEKAAELGMNPDESPYEALDDPFRTGDQTEDALNDRRIRLGQAFRGLDVALTIGESSAN